MQDRWNHLKDELELIKQLRNRPSQPMIRTNLVSLNIYFSFPNICDVSYWNFSFNSLIKAVRGFTCVIVYRMEFDKTKWSCTENSARGWWGSGVVGDDGGQGW